MKTILIDANQFKTFGRAERYFLENPIEAFENTDVILTGAFDTDCYSLLLEYLKKHHVKFNSLTYSNDLTYIPMSEDFLPSENLIIPEGVDTIDNFTFINTKIKSISLPESLQKISEKAFVNCSIQNIILSEKNQTFTLMDGIIKNSLTKQIILKTESAKSQDATKWQKENNTIWKKFSEMKSLPVTAAHFWKKYFYEIKDELKLKKLLVSANTNLDTRTQLKNLLQVLPDSFGNLYKLPAREIENHFFPYLISLQYLTEGKQKRIYPDQNTCFRSFFDPVSSVYCYNSTLLAPEPLTVLFIAIDNGFELIIPKLQLLLFFSQEELTLIPAFLLKLEKTLPEILENLIDENTNYIKDNSYEKISDQSRQNILFALSKN